MSVRFRLLSMATAIIAAILFLKYTWEHSEPPPVEALSVDYPQPGEPLTIGGIEPGVDMLADGQIIEAAPPSTDVVERIEDCRVVFELKADATNMTKAERRLIAIVAADHAPEIPGVAEAEARAAIFGWAEAPEEEDGYSVSAGNRAGESMASGSHQLCIGYATCSGDRDWQVHVIERVCDGEVNERADAGADAEDGSRTHWGEIVICDGNGDCESYRPNLIDEEMLDLSVPEWNKVPATMEPSDWFLM